MRRVIAYIDGYNLYRGIKSRVRPHRSNATPWPPLYWLNLQLLANNLLDENHVLDYTYYFTARISSPEDSRQRQNLYLDALNTLDEFEICYGRFQVDTDNTCHGCSRPLLASKEKMTDVNIAVQMLADARNNRFDTALLITGDTDQVPVITAIHETFERKKVLVAFPPNRHNDHLERTANKIFRISKTILVQSQFADEMQRQDGFALCNPWQVLVKE